MAQDQTTSQQLSGAACKLHQAFADAMAEYTKERRAQSVRAGREASRRRCNQLATRKEEA